MYINASLKFLNFLAPMFSIEMTDDGISTVRELQLLKQLACIDVKVLGRYTASSIWQPLNARLGKVAIVESSRSISSTFRRLSNEPGERADIFAP